MPIKSVKMNISKKKKKMGVFFLMSQGSLSPKSRFPCQKMCTDAQTHTQTDTKVNTEGTLSGFQDYSFNLSSRIGPTHCPVTEILHLLCG